MINQLKEQLKRLKLSGMLEYIDLRILESQQNQLSYSEFLSMLVTDEIEKRNMAKLGRLIKQANLGVEKTLERVPRNEITRLDDVYVLDAAARETAFQLIVG